MGRFQIAAPRPKHVAATTIPNTDATAYVLTRSMRSGMVYEISSILASLLSNGGRSREFLRLS